MDWFLPTGVYYCGSDYWIIYGLTAIYDVTDDAYSDMSEEEETKARDLMVGRFPVQTYAELNACVSKTIHFETNPTEAGTDWLNAYISQHLFMETSIDQLNYEDLFFEYLPIIRTKQKEFYKINGRIQENRADTIQALVQAGVALGSYQYHGSTYNGFLGLNEFPWSFDNSNKNPIIITGGCSSGEFTDPTQQGFTERAVKHPTYPERGCVASIGASGLNLMGTLNQKIVRELHCRDRNLLTYDSTGNVKRWTPYRLIQNNCELSYVLSSDSYSHTFVTRRLTLQGDPSLNTDIFVEDHTLSESRAEILTQYIEFPDPNLVAGRPTVAKSYVTNVGDETVSNIEFGFYFAGMSYLTLDVEGYSLIAKDTLDYLLPESTAVLSFEFDMPDPGSDSYFYFKVDRITPLNQYAEHSDDGSVLVINRSGSAAKPPQYDIWMSAATRDSCPGDPPYNTNQNGVCSCSKQKCVNGEWTEDYSLISSNKFRNFDSDLRSHEEYTFMDFLNEDCDMPGWSEHRGIISGLPDWEMYKHYDPAIAYNLRNDSLWVLIGNVNFENRYEGYYWDPTQKEWISDISIVNGLNSPYRGSSPELVFNLRGDSTWVLIVGAWHGYYWNGSEWVLDNTLVEGLYGNPSRCGSNPTVTRNLNGYGLFNMITGSCGFYWDGDEWVSDNSILTGIDDTILCDTYGSWSNQPTFAYNIMGDSLHNLIVFGKRDSTIAPGWTIPYWLFIYTYSWHDSIWVIEDTNIQCGYDYEKPVFVGDFAPYPALIIGDHFEYLGYKWLNTAIDEDTRLTVWDDPYNCGKPGCVCKCYEDCIDGHCVKIDGDQDGIAACYKDTIIGSDTISFYNDPDFCDCDDNDLFIGVNEYKTVFTSPASDTAWFDSLFVYHASASDSDAWDDTLLTYFYSALPPWLTQSGDSIYGSPPDLYDTTFNITVFADDYCGKSDTMVLEIYWKSDVITPVTVIIDSIYDDYDFKFTLDSTEYSFPSTLNLHHGSKHDLIFNGSPFYGYETQSDGISVPYQYLGRFEEWVYDSVYETTTISVRVPPEPDTVICRLKDIQAGPEIRLRHGEFFDIDGEKKPALTE